MARQGPVKRRTPKPLAGGGITSPERRYVRAASTVTSKGQTVIPKEVREALDIGPGTRLRWVMNQGTLCVFAMPDDPVAALDGALAGIGHPLKDFLRDRQEEREEEEAKLEQLGYGLKADG